MTDATPATTQPSFAGQPWRATRVWLAVFVSAGALYVLTADRGVQWQDSGWQQLRITTGDISHPAGLVLTHPLQFHLGRLAIATGLFEPALAVTLVSCLAGAAALANLGALVWLLTRSVWAVGIPLAALAFSHTWWLLATHAESYTLVAALLSAEWLCLLRFAQTGRWRYLPLLALVNGLGVANHLLAALATPVDLVVIALALRRSAAIADTPAEASRRALRPLIALGCLLAWVAGAGPYLWLVGADVARGADVIMTLRSATVGKYASQVLNTHLAVRPLVLSAAFFIYNFPNFTLPLAIYGVLRGVMPRLVRRVLLIELFVYLVFVVRYSIPDQYTFFVPVYAILAVFAGAGVHAIAARWRPTGRRRLLAAAAITACWTPLLYPAAAITLRRTGALAGLVPPRPYADSYWLYLVPWGVGNDHAQRLNAEIRRLGGERPFVILGPTMVKFALTYDQHLG